MARFLATLLLLLIPVFAPQQALADDFYKTGMRMGTAYCPNTEIDCSDVTGRTSDLVQNANTCIASQLGIPEPIMSDFKSSGEMENCIVPSQPFANARGFNVWAVCCVKKNGDACNLECTRYTSQR